MGARTVLRFAEAKVWNRAVSGPLPPAACRELAQALAGLRERTPEEVLVRAHGADPAQCQEV